MTAARLSDRQRAVLTAVENGRHWSTGPQILARLQLPGVTVEGVHQTAASLARRGLLLRRRESGEPVAYTIATTLHTHRVEAAREKLAAAETRDARRAAREELNRTLAGATR